MPKSSDYRVSYWWSSLMEFGEEVLVRNRKKIRLSQQEIANKLNLSQSEISRIERGLVRPHSLPAVREFCDVYQLTSSQKKKYLELINGISLIHSADLNNLLQNQVQFIARLNRSGYPKIAIKQFENLRTWLVLNTNFKDGANSASIQIFSRLLLEESAAWWDVVLPSETPKNTDALIKKMDMLAKLSGEGSRSDYYLKINKGFHAYINNNYQLAKSYFNKVLPKKEQLDSLWKLEVFRASLVTFSKVKDYESIFRLEPDVYNFVNNKSIDSTAKGYLLEGFARAHIEIDIQKALQHFDLAGKYILKARMEPDFLSIRYIQLTRSLICALRFQNKSRSALIRIAEPALNEAERRGFKRHQQEILEYINS